MKLYLIKSFANLCNQRVMWQQQSALWHERLLQEASLASRIAHSLKEVRIHAIAVEAGVSVFVGDSVGAA